jgi:hypothetical protein
VGGESGSGRESRQVLSIEWRAGTGKEVAVLRAGLLPYNETESPYDLAGFEAIRDEVERMISGCRPFGEIEDCIEAMSASDDEKSALWLLAWSGQPEPVRHQTVAEALALAAGRG